MRNIILSLSNGMHQFARYAAVSALLIMFLTVMVQVIARYVFSTPPIWTEDVARYMMVWSGLLGATLSFKTRADAVLVESVFPNRPHFLAVMAESIQTTAIVIFLGPVVWFCFFGLQGGLAKGYLARQAGLTVDTLGIAKVWIALAVPLSMIIILIHLLARWFETTPTTKEDY